MQACLWVVTGASGLIGRHAVRAFALTSPQISPNPRLPDDYDRSILGWLRSVLDAAIRAGVKRLLYVSCSGASAQAANSYLGAKGRAEEMVCAKPRFERISTGLSGEGPNRLTWGPSHGARPKAVGPEGGPSSSESGRARRWALK